mmetsp:Transcript_23002/g.33641  ORF Transcript_23002/g.33641 Transcript_23002/m.33641 type:complete len:330 (-) Transcript_23002:128-1117(-)
MMVITRDTLHRFVYFILFLSAHLCEDLSDELTPREWCRYINESPEPDIIVFNRYMKCGSTTMNTIISRQERLQRTLNKRSFRFVSQDGAFWNRHSSHAVLDKLAELRRSANNLTIVVEGHFLWKNFSDTTSPFRIEYMQLLRNCADRHTSNYFYRLPDHGRNLDMHPDVLRCLLDKSCISKDTDLQHMSTSEYSDSFCGMPCSPEDALVNISPENGRYSAVGTLEHFNKYLELLECVFPSVFGGVLNSIDIFKIRENSSGGSNISVSENVRSVISERCVGSDDESLHKTISLLLLSRHQYMMAHRSNCCRKSSIHQRHVTQKYEITDVT